VSSRRKNTPLVLTVFGLAIMAQSMAWEFVRVEPTYRFLIDPWSLRGYEVAQGLVIAAGAVVIAVLAILLSYGVLKETLAHSIIGVAMLVGFGVIAALLADAPRVKMPFPVHVILSAIGAVVARSVLERFIPDLWSKRRRAARVGLLLAGFLVALFAIVGPVLQNERPFWLVVTVIGVFLGALAMFRAPQALAGWRMVINGIVGIWVMSMAMAASLRVTLDRVQFDLNGISADVKNLQITSGVLWAWFGGLIAFVGAVGMWAKRRDEIIAHERARQQQEAARESEAQLSVTG
jgi:hypothetical protein